MDTATIVEIAKREAANFCALRHPWGLTSDDVYTRILEEIAADGIFDIDKVLTLPMDAESLKAQIREAVNRAIGKCRNLSKEHRSRIEPFQVRKVRENGGDIDQAYNLLGYDMQCYFKTNLNNAKREKYLKIAFRFMRPEDVQICREYMKHGTWEAVAALHGMSESDFRRKVLPALRTRAQAVWKKVW